MAQPMLSATLGNDQQIPRWFCSGVGHLAVSRDSMEFFFLIEYYPKLVVGGLTTLKVIIQACFLLACCTPLSQVSWPVFWQRRWVRVLAFASHTGWMRSRPPRSSHQGGSNRLQPCDQLLPWIHQESHWESYRPLLSSLHLLDTIMGGGSG